MMFTRREGSQPDHAASKAPSKCQCATHGEADRELFLDPDWSLEP